MKKSNILRILLLVLAGVMIGVGIYNINASTLVGDKMPMPLGFGVSVVLSGSMEPTLSVDDVVFIRKTSDVDLDDIVVFQSGSTLVIHKVIAVDGDMITTKGDANNIADDPIPRSDIKGVMMFAVPGAGVIVNFIKQPAVTVLLIVLAVWLTERSFRLEKKKDRDELERIEKEITQLKKDIEKEEK